MEFSQSDSNAFSVRIVSIDHYMAPPIHGLDISYSSFQGTVFFHSQTTPFNSFFFFLFFVNFFKCLILEIEFSIEKKVKLISQFSKYISWIFTLFFFWGGAKLQLPSWNFVNFYKTIILVPLFIVNCYKCKTCLMGSRGVIVFLLFCF